MSTQGTLEVLIESAELKRDTEKWGKLDPYIKI